MSDTVAAEDIREFRWGLGWRRKQLAKVLGVSMETVRSWEDGRRVCSGPAAKLLSLFMHAHGPIVVPQGEDGND